MNNLLQKLMLGGSTLAMAAILPAGAALAQDNADIEQVVVSASRITIAGYSQPTPVTVVGAAQLQQDGYSNIADSVRQLPQVTAPPTSFSASQAASASGVVGANLINLRNLGYTRTLVLFDSQRVVSSSLGTGGNGGVDVTTLPTGLIQRVDVVTGGASAAWGSDAVAGVVNFVINKNFNGFKATVQGSDTTDGLDRNLSLDTVWGGDVFGGRGHLEFALDAKISPDTVLLTDKHWFNDSYWVSNPAFAAGNGQPQLIVANNVGFANGTMGGLIVSSPAGTAGPGVVAASANALRGIQFTGGGVPSIVNFGNITVGTLSNGGSLGVRDTLAPWATIANPGNTYSFFGYGRYKLTDTIQASVQVNYGYYTGKSLAGGGMQTAAVIKSDNAYLPASVASAMQNGGITSFNLGTLNGNNYNSQIATGRNAFAMAEAALSPGVDFLRRNLIRGVFTLEGTLGDDWSWNAYIQHSGVRSATHFLGTPLTANLLAAEDAVTVTSANVAKSGLALGSIACRSTLSGTTVASGLNNSQPGCIPIDVFGNGVASPAAIAYVTGATNNAVNYGQLSMKQEVAEGSMQGTLPWELPAGKVAVAFGVGYRKEAAVQNGPAIGATQAYVNSNTTIFPSRSYNVIEGFGEVDAPILKNNIVDSLDFTMAGRMTSYSTSGLVETWKLGATSQINDDIKLRTSWSVDIRAPQLFDLYTPGTAASQSQRDPKTQLNANVINSTIGNINLVPEIARTVSGGVVLTPTFVPGLSLSADWYSINMTGVITVIPVATVLAQCNATLPSQINPGQNGNPNDPICSTLIFDGPNGALGHIRLIEQNLASLTTSGLDLSADYTMDFWEGSLAWHAMATLNDEVTLTSPGIGANDSAGSDSTNPAAGPKWRGSLATTYATGPYAFTVQTRWFGTGVTQQNGNTGNLATAATANLYDPAHFEVPFTAYLDLRGNYKWNDNISFFGAIDNTLNTPPPLVANPGGNSTQAGSPPFYNTNPFVYDMLGRTFRVGLRLNY